MEVFSKFLSATDTTVRLSIPTNALPHLRLYDGRDLVVKDWTGKEWKFHFSTRNIGHPRPVFTGNWLSFAQAMRLQVYDLLIFSQVEDGHYRIEVLRETDLKLFGQEVIWASVNSPA